MPLPTDPLLQNQWHLRNTTPGLLDLNVIGVWNPSEGASYTGAGVVTVIIDDGFDYNHSDFTNYAQAFDFDFELNTLDPFGGASDAHGTAVSGIIGAAANGTGAVGIAFDTMMIGYRTAGLISDAWLQDISESIASAATNALADVVNISQGIANDASSEFGFGYDALRFDEIETSIGTAVNTGRGGLGMTIVKSAGNSRADNYDVNADDWTNDTRQVVVAAVDQNGFVSSYSSYGAAVLVSGFGTPGEVVTTDRVGADGYDLGDFTSTFNGTSSAAPMVSGVVALVYEAQSQLGWRDVQSILAATARQVGSEVGAGTAGSERYAWGWNGADTWNGGGMHFSNDYGYGLVDALAAVRLAESWLMTGESAATTTNEFSSTVDVLNASTVIPDANATGLNFAGTISFDDVVERMTVTMTFATTFLADMDVFLISPNGTVSELIADNAGGADFNGTWTFESMAFRGERAAGVWTVRVADDLGGDVLTVTDIVIRAFGAATTNDRYIFTNELSDYAGVSGHATDITDNNNGTDTANAAAVSSASLIRLDGNFGLIDGVSVRLANVENAIGGDGNDTLIGSTGNNQLFGMRGDDRLSGFGGADTMGGGTGNDTYITDGGDTITELANQGVDTVRSSVSFSLTAHLEDLVLTGTASIDATGNTGNNQLTGNSGNNELRGSGGNDTMRGGAGNDIYVTDGGDLIIENAGQGVDTVRSRVSFTLGANFENLVLIDTAAINGTGNAGANEIYGNDSNNMLNGLAGADTMQGGGGNDIYITSGGDTIIEGAGRGIDAVRSSVDHALSANIENLVLLGGGAINGTGNGLGNVIVGNSGANFINGGRGADTLIGGAGGDRFVFNSALGGGNVDTINDFNVVADTIRLENAVFQGIATGVLAAAAFVNNLTGVASDASDRIIYERDTGRLFYDADGTGGTARVQFALVDTGLAMTNADFFVI